MLGGSVPTQIVEVKAFIGIVRPTDIVPAVLLALNDVNLKGLFHNRVGYKRKAASEDAALCVWGKGI